LLVAFNCFIYIIINKIKLRVKIIGRVKALITYMLSLVLTHFASNNVTLSVNALQKCVYIR
jgi:hypothetical protein